MSGDGVVKLATFQEMAAKAELLTEDSVALAFAERHRDELRFDHHVGKWYVWNGARWQYEDTCLAFSQARTLVRELAKGMPEKVRLIASKAAFCGAVERFARADRAFATTSDAWDQDGYLLGTPAGTVDLRTGEIRQAVPEDYITKATAVAPAGSADCPRWLQFLHEAAGGDQDLINFLRQFAGYSLTGDTKEHALIFAYGGGGNGKTVFLNTIAGIMGDYATASAMDTFVASSSDRHPTDLAMLRGASLVYASETEEGRQWAEARIKQMTGGDRIRARFMRQDFFEYLPQFKLLLIGNHQPSLRNVDDAARRRFNIVPLTRKPATPDRDLEAKLRAEWPGILRWMIDGCITWQKTGLVRPQVVTQATSEYFEEQDTIRQWIDERCETGKVLADTSTNLFRSWSTWANAHGERPGTTKWFVQAMRRIGFRQYRQNKARGFFGIEAKPDAVAAHWSDES
jgi:putative DNA primase/helicase